MRAIYILLYLLSSSLTAFGQIPKDLFTEEKVKYQYDNKKPKEYFTPKIEIGKEIEVNFDCCFNDTVEVYVNDRLIERSFFRTEESFGLAKTRIIRFDSTAKNTKLTIVLPNKKVFCEISLNRKYKILHVNRMEHWNNTWPIIFRNFGIIYE